MIKYFFLLFFSFYSISSIAQIDTNYIKKIDNFISVGLNMGFSQNNFNIRNSSKNYELNSNFVPSLGLWFKYKKWPALAIGIPLTSINSDSLAKSQGIKIALKSQIAKGFIIEGYLFYLKGFNFRGLNGEKNIRPMPNTFDLNINFELFYLLNYKRFSYKNAYLFGENQKKSAGTFTLGFSTGFLSLSTKIPFFRVGNDSNKDLDFESIATFSGSILGGYMHTFVFGKNKKWYTNFSAFIGPNIHLGGSRYYRGKEQNGFFGLGYHFKYKVAIGYRIKRTSFRLFNDTSLLSYDPSKVSFIVNNVFNIKLGSVYRF